MSSRVAVVIQIRIPIALRYVILEANGNSFLVFGAYAGRVDLNWTFLMKIPEEAVTLFHVNGAVPISENF